MFAKAVSATSNVMYSYLLIILLLFAFTTLLGNIFYCEGCLNYIAGRTLSARFMKGISKNKHPGGPTALPQFFSPADGCGYFLQFYAPQSLPPIEWI